MEMKRLGLVCVLLLVSQLLLVECNKQKEGKKDREKKEKAQVDDGNQKSAKKEEKKQAGSDQNEKGQKSKAGKGPPQGKFSNKEKADCRWAVSEADTVSLKVECTKGGASFWCVFAGNPSSCPQFVANQKPYWKQIGRALKKQKNICQDPKSVLKSKECKKGPQEAHLSLLSSSLAEAAPAKEQTKTHHGRNPPHNADATAASKADVAESSNDCLEDVETIDQKKIGEEYCGESWSSFCTFFFSMVQNKKC